MPELAEAAAPTTVRAHLRPIDREGLMTFAEKGRSNPASRGTNKVRTGSPVRTFCFAPRKCPRGGCPLRQQAGIPGVGFPHDARGDFA